MTRLEQEKLRLKEEAIAERERAQEEARKAAQLEKERQEKIRRVRHTPKPPSHSRRTEQNTRKY